MPKHRAAKESPAINPPPTSEVVLMSAGNSPSTGALLLGLIMSRIVSYNEEITPPPAHQYRVFSSTNPPKDEAYGLGRINASRTKSVARPVLESEEYALYRALPLMSLRSTSVTTPIKRPSWSAFMTAGFFCVMPRKAPTNLK